MPVLKLSNKSVHIFELSQYSLNKAVRSVSPPLLDFQTTSWSTLTSCLFPFLIHQKESSGNWKAYLIIALLEYFIIGGMLCFHCRSVAVGLVCVYTMSKISMPITDHVRIKNRVKAWQRICITQYLFLLLT